MSRKRAGCLTLTPSRSTVFQPLAALSRSTSTIWSSRRFTSSMYKTPRLTRAKMPGSKALPPSSSARSMSMVPVTRSSVAPSGSSTKGVRRISTGKSSPAAKRSRTSSLCEAGFAGSELYLSSATVGMSGNSRTKARTAVDLPVPRSPWIKTPPMTGSIKFNMRASFMSSCPTTAENGNAVMPKSDVAGFSATAGPAARPTSPTAPVCLETALLRRSWRRHAAHATARPTAAEATLALGHPLWKSLAAIVTFCALVVRSRDADRCRGSCSNLGGKTASIT
mmetsp:Transcript_62792/g.120905  ORF Transcript_62792/g.120905 Transcript_62792/m.120905 type:complete len:280 (+) Transcript_62792:552-1391(+)